MIGGSDDGLKRFLLGSTGPEDGSMGFHKPQNDLSLAEKQAF